MSGSRSVDHCFAALYFTAFQCDIKAFFRFLNTGQMAESSRIDNYPGFYGINGYELGEKIREHAEALGIKFLEAEVTGIQKKNSQL